MPPGSQWCCSAASACMGRQKDSVWGGGGSGRCFPLTAVTDPKFVLFNHVLFFARIMSTLCPNYCRQTARMGGGNFPPAHRPVRLCLLVCQIYFHYKYCPACPNIVASWTTKKYQQLRSSSKKRPVVITILLIMEAGDKNLNPGPNTPRPVYSLCYVVIQQ